MSRQVKTITPSTEDINRVVKLMLHNARGRVSGKRAQQSAVGLEMKLTPAWVKKTLKDQNYACPETREPYFFGTTGDRGLSHPARPSLDRIDPTKGYTKDNVRITSWLINMVRSNYRGKYNTTISRMLKRYK